MGDMADMALDHVMDMEEKRLDWMTGHMSDLEAMECGVLDEQGYYHGPSSGTSKQCKFCGKDGLRWGQTESGWRLFDGTAIHTCKEYKP